MKSPYSVKQLVNEVTGNLEFLVTKDDASCIKDNITGYWFTSESEAVACLIALSKEFYETHQV